MSHDILPAYISICIRLGRTYNIVATSALGPFGYLALMNYLSGYVRNSKEFVIPTTHTTHV
ncbi:hypothetical protein BDM02DRAFT_3115062 [Thelephora ganbajun]|uniref:Uncharacterized protein n=1 Tax=Thelephora ganbajun TaxID=370292 RepID=A0ACB6ZGM4_THEGA|nr:hypothetical protein BDM02DRAFT_3115062 [Thelephora ganbajun]